MNKNSGIKISFFFKGCLLVQNEYLISKISDKVKISGTIGSSISIELTDTVLRIQFPLDCWDF